MKTLTKMKVYESSHARCKVHYRPETSDEKVLKEVIDNHAYRKLRIGFDVEKGEHWADLGGNIGAFAVYCQLQGATSHSYEPDSECYAVLHKNTKLCTHAAISTVRSKTVNLFTHAKPGDHSRNSMFERPRYAMPVEVPNLHASALSKHRFDGIKLDMEGGEFGVLDSRLVPASVKKLVMEYHTSIDCEMKHFKLRMNYLKSLFTVVSYPAEFDRALKSGAEKFKPFFDRTVFAIGRKTK